MPSNGRAHSGLPRQGGCGRADAPAADRGVHGDLASILSAAGAGSPTKPKTPRPYAMSSVRTKGEGVVLSVVAGVGFEPTTFRL